jgi:alkyl hydroperoxide reductase subunit AhpC
VEKIWRYGPREGRQQIVIGSISQRVFLGPFQNPCRRPWLNQTPNKFRDKHDLNFPLLSDADHKVAEKYGAWREKNMYGKKSMGIQRSTYLIDSAGKIAKVWKRVQVNGHDDQVLEALQELTGKA